MMVLLRRATAADGSSRAVFYEQLLGDALQGIATRFATQQIIEGTWMALSKILEHPSPVIEYAPGTMGPEEADELIAPYGGWIEPVGSKSDHPA